MTALEAALSELSAFPIFLDLSKELIFELCSGGQIVTSSHRERLFNFGNEASFFGVILSGAYKLSRPMADGTDVIVHFSTPGDVLAAFIMAQPKPVFPVSAVAMGPSRFLKIPKASYLSKWKKSPELIFRVQNLLSSRMSLLQDHKVMAKAPLAQKVAALLISLVEKNPSEEGLVLPLPLTRKEIADNLGASVEAVIRIMSDWSKQGIIHTNEQNIRILRPDYILAILKDL